MKTLIEPGENAVLEDLLRNPDRLMTPNRLGALAPSRLSATRALINVMTDQHWKVEQTSFEIDAKANGTACYRISVPGGVFSFLVLSFAPHLQGRTARIIGRNWDMMGSLIEGEATERDFLKLSQEIPKLYSGRATPQTLIWCRANRSLRGFDLTIESLANEKQPDLNQLKQIGYLMRNTGLDGNGTFGTKSFLAYEPDHPLRIPLHAQMLAAFMMREFSFDLVEHVARTINQNAALLSPDVKRALGVGNASAMGLVLFVNSHPAFIDSWLNIRQRAIAVVSSMIIEPESLHADRLTELLEIAWKFHASDSLKYTNFEDPKVIAEGLRIALITFGNLLEKGATTPRHLLEELAPKISLQAWEIVAAEMLELNPAEVDKALSELSVCELFVRNPLQTVGELRSILKREYAWALTTNMNQEDARKYVWYKSQDSEEPRRGPISEVIGGRNWALDLPTDIQALELELNELKSSLTVGEYLASRPEQRGVVERVQGLEGKLFHSPHMNMLDADFLPVHIIRFMNSAIHGLDRTVDGTRVILGLLFLGAPTRQDLMADDWSTHTQLPSSEPTVGVR